MKADFAIRCSLRPLGVLLGILLMAAPGWSADPVDHSQQQGSFKTTLSKSIACDYLLFLPAGYSAHPEKRWPTLLFLHGSGENGSDVERLRRAPVPRLIQSALDGTSAASASVEAAKVLTSEFIVLSPQCPAGRGWAADELIALLDDVAAKYRVDSSRVYVTGLSMGGFGAWSIGLKYPQRFAAIAPICGGGDLVDVGAGLPAKQPALQSLPIWVFHGEKDPVVAPSESERMIAAVKRVSGNNQIRLTLYPEAGHDSWTATYNNPELYHWFLQHHR